MWCNQAVSFSHDRKMFNLVPINTPLRRCLFFTLYIKLFSVGHRATLIPNSDWSITRSQAWKEEEEGENKTFFSGLNVGRVIGKKQMLIFLDIILRRRMPGMNVAWQSRGIYSQQRSLSPVYNDWIEMYSTNPRQNLPSRVQIQKLNVPSVSPVRMETAVVATQSDDDDPVRHQPRLCVSHENPNLIWRKRQTPSAMDIRHGHTQHHTVVHDQIRCVIKWGKEENPSMILQSSPCVRWNLEKRFSNKMSTRLMLLQIFCPFIIRFCPFYFIHFLSEFSWMLDNSSPVDILQPPFPSSPWFLFHFFSWKWKKFWKTVEFLYFFPSCL